MQTNKPTVSCYTPFEVYLALNELQESNLLIIDLVRYVHGMYMLINAAEFDFKADTLRVMKYLFGDRDFTNSVQMTFTKEKVPVRSKKIRYFVSGIDRERRRVCWVYKMRVDLTRQFSITSKMYFQGKECEHLWRYNDNIGRLQSHIIYHETYMTIEERIPIEYKDCVLYITQYADSAGNLLCNRTKADDRIRINKNRINREQLLKNF